MLKCTNIAVFYVQIIFYINLNLSEFWCPEKINKEHHYNSVSFQI